jgi:hypothetical protein
MDTDKTIFEEELPEVTSVTWPEACSAHARVFPRIFKAPLGRILCNFGCTCTHPFKMTPFGVTWPSAWLTSLPVAMLSITLGLDSWNIFRDLDVSWFLPLIFVFIQHLKTCCSCFVIDVCVNVWYFHNVFCFVQDDPFRGHVTFGVTDVTSGSHVTCTTVLLVLHFVLLV